MSTVSTISATAGFDSCDGITSAYSATINLADGSQEQFDLIDLTSEYAQIRIVGRVPIDATTIEIVLGSKALTRLFIRAVRRDDPNTATVLFEQTSASVEDFVRIAFADSSAVSLKTPWIHNYHLIATPVALAVNAMVVSMPANALVLPGTRFGFVFHLGRFGSMRFDARVTGSELLNGHRNARLAFSPLRGRRRRIFARFAACMGAEYYRDADELAVALRRARLFIAKLGPAITISIARTSPDVRSAVYVRAKAYAKAGKVAASTAIHEMADEFDQHSVIFLARIGNLTVGTVRMQKQRDGFLPFKDVYPGISPSDDATTAEISRLAVDPAFQRTEVGFALIKQCIELSICWGCRVGYLLVTPALEQMYSRFGAVSIATGASHGFKSGETLALYRFRLIDMLRARGVLPIVHLLINLPAAYRYAPHGLVPVRPAIVRPTLRAAASFASTRLKAALALFLKD